MGDGINTITDEEVEEMEKKTFNKAEPKKHYKLKSVKLWFAIWAALALSVVIYAMAFRDVQGLSPIALGLLAIIAEYLHINYKQKKLFNSPESEA